MPGYPISYDLCDLLSSLLSLMLWSVWCLDAAAFHCQGFPKEVPFLWNDEWWLWKCFHFYLEWESGTFLNVVQFRSNNRLPSDRLLGAGCFPFNKWRSSTGAPLCCADIGSVTSGRAGLVDALSGDVGALLSPHLLSTWSFYWGTRLARKWDSG